MLLTIDEYKKLVLFNFYLQDHIDDLLKIKDKIYEILDTNKEYSWVLWDLSIRKENAHL